MPDLRRTSRHNRTHTEHKGKGGAQVSVNMRKMKPAAANDGPSRPEDRFIAASS